MMSEDLEEMIGQLRADIGNSELRIEVLKQQGKDQVRYRRKKIAVLAKLTDRTVEETEDAKDWVKEST